MRLANAIKLLSDVRNGLTLNNGRLATYGLASLGTILAYQPAVHLPATKLAALIDGWNLVSRLIGPLPSEDGFDFSLHRRVGHGPLACGNELALHGQIGLLDLRVRRA